MKTAEMIKLVSEKAEVTQKDADKVIKAFAEVIKENVMNDEVPFAGIGKFVRKERAARDGRNPSDGTPLKIPACDLPGFKMSPTFRDSLKVVK